MDWKREAIEDLRNYTRRKQSLENLPKRIEALEQDSFSVRAGLGSEPVSGGTSMAEDRMINNISERERLGHNLCSVRRLVELTEQGLDSLTREERLVLERFFINRQRGYLERLMDELGYERRQIYRIKDNALKKYTMVMFGIVEW